MKPKFRCTVSALESWKSARSNTFSWFPLSCITVNSGGSRKRPLFRPLTAIKFPQFLPPYATFASTFEVPNDPYDVVIAPCGVVTPNPERVVTSITTLVLSPNSAGGAPAITSMDSIESIGIWFENTLLCWSVIGWPSTENEFSAWSPSPWNSPLESAAMPGVASVTSELTDDDALSSGNLSNNPRSTSVCDTDVFSIRFSLVLCTSTVVNADPSVSPIFRFTGTADRSSTSCA